MFMAVPVPNVGSEVRFYRLFHVIVDMLESLKTNGYTKDSYTERFQTILIARVHTHKIFIVLTLILQVQVLRVGPIFENSL